MTAPSTIDVIVPIYNAYEDVVTCIASVRRHTRPERYRLILIDDKSPDPRIGSYLESLREEHDAGMMIVRNERNLGFVGTVNHGMGLSSENDVVLLNSDTIVTPGWLEKLRRCAESDPQIGTITPFSNNAEICSFPVFCQNNDLAGLPDIELINQAMEMAALPSYPDIPTAVGFCMYIRRTLLRKIGFFDAETFGLGYGEENDFCMRAIKAGYRNVLCDDTFVAHTGSRSFDQKKQALIEANTRLLVAKHPHYPEQVHRFIAADPLQPLRKLAGTMLRILQEPGMHGVLHILHSRQGGTESHIRDLMRAETRHYRHYLLIVQENQWLLEDGNGEPWLLYELHRGEDEPWADLLNALCATLRVSLCHVHHISGARNGLLIALAGLRIPYGITLHDSYLACPTVTLLNPSGEYCGGVSDTAACQRCVNAQTLYRGIRIADWREEHRALVARAAFLLAPSRSVADTFRTYYPDTTVQIIPHGTETEALRQGSPDGMCSVLLLPHDRHEVVGVLGAIGPVKGARRLERLVARTKARKAPLRWVLIGYTDHQYQPWQDKEKTLTIHGAYDKGALAALVEHYRIRLMVFPAAGPESFSYTLSETWALGCPALVPPIGALGERVSETGAGWLMEDWQNEDRIIDQILAICAPENAEAFAQRQAQAARVTLPTLADMAEATVAVYADRLASLTPSHLACGTPLPMTRLLTAAEAEKQSMSSTALQGWKHTLLRRLLHLALRIRHTRAGHWLYRQIPVQLQQRLKAYLVA